MMSKAYDMPYTVKKIPFKILTFDGVKKVKAPKYGSFGFSKYFIMAKLQQWFNFSSPVSNI